MKKLFKYFLQKYANFILSRMEKSKDQIEFEFWYSQGLQLDIFCEGIDIDLE